LPVLAAVLAVATAWAATPRQAVPGKQRPPARPHTVQAVRVGPGVIAVEWGLGKGQQDECVVLRSEAVGGPYRPVGKRPADRPWLLDAKVEPDRLYYYQVAAVNAEGVQSEPWGPTCAWDNDQIIPNGSFELDSAGLLKSPACPLWWTQRAYNPSTPVEIVRGGPDGRQCVEIRAAPDSISGGLRSMFIPMIEGESWHQQAWSKGLPGAHPRVGRCCLGEDRRPVVVKGDVKGEKNPYDYAPAGPARPDGWSLHAEVFRALPDTCYVQVWIIGYQSRNTFWFDGATMTDLTSRRVRAFDLKPLQAAAADAVRSPAKRPRARAAAEPLRGLETRMADLRKRMAGEMDRLSPLAYRRLLVELDNAQQDYVERVWTVRTLALLED
jgi:hypothetical protein